MAIDNDRKEVVYLLIEDYNQQLSHLSEVSNDALFMVANCNSKFVYPNIVNLTDDSGDSIAVYMFS